MAFTSLPAYLDPANWQQQLQNHQIAGSSGSNPELPLAAAPAAHVGGGGGSIRPGSMADRARLANITMPEASLKCPRCDSTNTKFCYFNNYNLSQPRHFCKTCRRYWTRGGALRNVPVGGGCRRNKRTNKSSSTNKSTATSTGGGGEPSTGAVSSSSSASMLGLSSQIPPFRFMAPLSQLTESTAPDARLTYGAPAVATGDMNFHIGNNFLGRAVGGTEEQWRFHHQQQPQQFPFLGGGLDAQGLFLPFQGSIVESTAGYSGESTGQGLLKLHQPGSMLSQLENSVKMEDNNRQVNLPSSKQFFMGILQGNNSNEQWTSSGAAAATAWADPSSFSTSSNTHPS